MECHLLEWGSSSLWKGIQALPRLSAIWTKYMASLIDYHRISDSSLAPGAVSGT